MSGLAKLDRFVFKNEIMTSHVGSYADVPAFSYISEKSAFFTLLGRKQTQANTEDLGKDGGLCCGQGLRQ